LRHTVRFAGGLQRLLAEPKRILLEVGPGRTLSSLLSHYPEKTAEHLALCSLRHPKDRVSDADFLLNTVGKLWLAGVRVDWQNFHSAGQPHRVSLPTYPFERKRFWIDAPARNGHQFTAPANVEAVETKLPPDIPVAIEPGLLERTLQQQLEIMSEQLAQNEQLLRQQLKLLR
jgi:acyl transferase domain-containing protein